MIAGYSIDWAFFASQLAFSIVLVLALWGVVAVQHQRHGRGALNLREHLIYGVYTGLLIVIGWELIDCWLYGPPGFPSTRWHLYALLAALLWLAVWKDRDAEKAPSPPA